MSANSQINKQNLLQANFISRYPLPILISLIHEFKKSEWLIFQIWSSIHILGALCVLERWAKWKYGFASWINITACNKPFHPSAWFLLLSRLLFVVKRSDFHSCRIMTSAPRHVESVCPICALQIVPRFDHIYVSSLQVLWIVKQIHCGRDYIIGLRGVGVIIII